MRQLLYESGPMLWVIMVCGLVGFIAFVERGFHLHRAKIKSDDFVGGILNILRRNNIEEALAICEETPGPVARVVQTSILHRDSGHEFLEASVNDAGLSEISRLEIRLGAIATVAQIAPLLGLLGTVLALRTLVGGFAGSQWHWEASVMSEGLNQALATTAAGLAVGIPCYAFYNLLAGKIEALVIDMERASSQLVAFFSSAAKNGKNMTTKDATADKRR